MATADTLFADPDWMPYAYDAPSNRLIFAHLPRETQRKATFLDERYVNEAAKSQPLSASDLPSDGPGETPAHYIFHTSFCCSTLLARALDIPGVSMGVKEPNILSAFSSLAGEQKETPQSRAALNNVLPLLARPVGENETMVVKPSNVANLLAESVLEADPRSRAIFIYSDVDSLIRSIASRGMWGRIFVRQNFRHFAPVLALPTGYDEGQIFELTDLQVAGLVWLMQVAHLDRVARRFGPDRVRTLNSESFLADKQTALSRTGAFFDLPADDRIWRDIASGPVFTQDSKEHAKPMNTEARRERHAETTAAHAEEIDMVTQWTQAVAQHCNAPTSLGDTLLQGLPGR